MITEDKAKAIQKKIDELRHLLAGSGVIWVGNDGYNDDGSPDAARIEKLSRMADNMSLIADELGVDYDEYYDCSRGYVLPCYCDD